MLKPVSLSPSSGEAMAYQGPDRRKSVQGTALLPNQAIVYTKQLCSMIGNQALNTCRKAVVKWLMLLHTQY
jgi:hypothetical protein